MAKDFTGSQIGDIELMADGSLKKLVGLSPDIYEAIGGSLGPGVLVRELTDGVPYVPTPGTRYVKIIGRGGGDAAEDLVAGYSVAEIGANAAVAIGTEAAQGTTSFNPAGSGATASAAGRSSLVRATAQATTSGTEKDFTSIPAGVKKITMVFNDISLSGTDAFLVQIGDSGGIETSGYVSVTTTNEGASNQFETSTSGFIIRVALAASVTSGAIELFNVDGNVWIATHIVKRNADTVAYGTGSKTLSATLDRIRLTRGGTNTFDAGSVNIFYEF